MPIKEKIANTYVSAILNSNGGPGGGRTRYTRIFSPLLYQMSYRAIVYVIKFQQLMADHTGIEPVIFTVTV